MSMELTIALSAAKTIFDLAKSLTESLSRKGKIDAKEVNAQLMEFQRLSLDMQAALHDLAEENRILREENANLKDKREYERELREEYQFEQGVYWKQGDTENPYCPLCLEIKTERQLNSCVFTTIR